MRKFFALLAALLLTGCSWQFKDTDIAPQWASSSSTNYVFTELTNYDRYTFRVFTWTVNPMNGKVKEDAAAWLAAKFPGAAVYNESAALIVINEKKE